VISPQQVPNGVDVPGVGDVKPVAGHGAGLTPKFPSSVEPIGTLGIPKRGVPAIDGAVGCEETALPTAGVWLHVLVDIVLVPEVPGCVAPMPVLTPPASKSPLEPGVPIIAVPIPVLVEPKQVVPAPNVDAPRPNDPGLTPGVASSVAPMGIPVGATEEPEGLMPSGEVEPIPKFGPGAAIPPTCAWPEPQPSNIAIVAAISVRVIVVSSFFCI